MSFPVLIKHLRNGNLLSHDGHEYRTPRTLIDKGIKFCYCCGEMLVDTMFCKGCGEDTLVIADDMHAPYTPPEKPELLYKKIVPDKPKTEANTCPVCGRAKTRTSATCSVKCGKRYFRKRKNERHGLHDTR